MRNCTANRSAIPLLRHQSPKLFPKTESQRLFSHKISQWSRPSFTGLVVTIIHSMSVSIISLGSALSPVHNFYFLSFLLFYSILKFYLLGRSAYYHTFVHHLINFGQSLQSGFQLDLEVPYCTGLLPSGLLLAGFLAPLAITTHMP